MAVLKNQIFDFFFWQSASAMGTKSTFWGISQVSSVTISIKNVLVFSSLLDATRRYALLDATRRYSTLVDCSRRILRCVMRRIWGDKCLLLSCCRCRGLSHAGAHAPGNFLVTPIKTLFSLSQDDTRWVFKQTILACLDLLRPTATATRILAGGLEVF
jgi:hypothetical protein